MPSAQLQPPLEIDHYYHIYNRGNNGEQLFYTQKNYDFFLERYRKYLGDHLVTYAYCLIPNHFHLLVRIRSEQASKQFQKLFQSYALSINVQENRSGSLFQKTFRRILIQDNVYLKWLVFYIHHNPEKHKVSDDYRKYPYCSYRLFLSGKGGLIDQEEVSDWFGGKKAFREFHRYYYERKGIEKDRGCEPGSQP